MTTKLQDAIDIATKYHKGQKRKDGRDYIIHPIAVMVTLRQHNFSEDALIAAVLHDVCEDTKLNNINLSELFGTRVGFIVNALTKNKKPKNNKELKAEYEKKLKKRKITNLETYSNFDEYTDYRLHLYLNRLYIGIIAEPWIFFIKVSDQLHNLSDMEFFPKVKRLRKINEIEKYFIPIYIKSKQVFNRDTKAFKEYNIFMELLYTTLEDAKKNII